MGSHYNIKDQRTGGYSTRLKTASRERLAGSSAVGKAEKGGARPVAASFIREDGKFVCRASEGASCRFSFGPVSGGSFDGHGKGWGGGTGRSQPLGTFTLEPPCSVKKRALHDADQCSTLAANGPLHHITLRVASGAPILRRGFIPTPATPP